MSRPEQPWVEQYRPSKLEDIVGNQAAVARLRIIAEQGNIPNLILSGPPGVGKTTSLMCLCRKLLGDQYKDAIIELNASDERGIEVVRDTIKNFAKRHVNLPAGRQKIVFLDEADSMTSAAQQAMRRTMEKYSATTRFVFACNESEKVIEPLQSRCAILRFTRVQDGEVYARLQTICEDKGVNFTDDGLSAIANLSDGDMRTAVNALQATAARYDLINADNVTATIDAPSPEAIMRMVTRLKEEGDLRDALTVMYGLQKRGHSSSDIVGSIFRTVRKDPSIEDKLKVLLLKEIGMCQMSMAQGLASPLQLDALLANLYEVFAAHQAHK